MTQDVLLSIRGLQFDADADSGTLETITPAEYFQKNSQHYLIYDEVMEGFHDSTKNIIKWNDSTLDLTKRGVVNVHMIFEENKKNMTEYKTPFGSILIGIDTHGVNVKEEEERISIQVDYALEINYEHLAECKINMDVRPKKEAARFL